MVQIEMRVHSQSDSVSFRDRLKKWHSLERRRQRLERLIPEQEQRLALLKDKLSAPGILSSITQQTVNMDMPRGTDISDRVGDTVAETIDKIAELELRLQSWRIELAEIYSELSEIEYCISDLSDRHQSILTMYYRDRLSRQRICEAVYVSERRMYDMIKEALEAKEKPLA